MSNAGVIFRRIGGRIIPIARNMAIGGVAGGLSGRAVSDSNGAPSGQKTGLKIGLAVGAIASISPKFVGRVAKHFSSRYWMGVKASAAAKGAARAASKPSLKLLSKLK